MKSGVNSSLLSSSIGKALILSLLLECIRLSDMVHKLGDKYRTSFPVFPCACVCECEYVCSMFEAQTIVDPIHTMVDKSVHWLTECDIWHFASLNAVTMFFNSVIEGHMSSVWCPRYRNWVYQSDTAAVEQCCAILAHLHTHLQCLLGSGCRFLTIRTLGFIGSDSPFPRQSRVCSPDWRYNAQCVIQVLRLQQRQTLDALGP